MSRRSGYRFADKDMRRAKRMVEEPVLDTIMRQKAL
jgi:hypothetical protein